jgi:hypothetical protein
MILEVPLAVKMSTGASSIVTPCRLVGFKCPNDGGSVFVQNVGTNLQVHDITTQMTSMAKSLFALHNTIILMKIYQC